MLAFHCLSGVNNVMKSQVRYEWVLWHILLAQNDWMWTYVAQNFQITFVVKWLSAFICCVDDCELLREMSRNLLWALRASQCRNFAIQTVKNL